MSKRANLEKPLAVVISFVIFAIVIAGFLALQFLLNHELEVLYEEIGQVTKIKSSFIATAIFMGCCFIFLIISHLDRKDIFMEETFFVFAYAIIIILMIAMAIWGQVSAAEGLKKLENNNAKILVTLPTSLMLYVGLFVLYIGLLDKFFHDGLNPFLVYLLFPFLVFLVGFLATFFIYKIQIGWLRDTIYFVLSVGSFIVGGIFFVIYSCVGEMFNIEHEDYQPAEHSYSSSGFDSSVSYVDYRKMIEEKIESKCYNARISGLNSTFDKGSIDHVRAEISSGTCSVYVETTIDYRSSMSMSESEANRRADEAVAHAKTVFTEIAQEILDDSDLDISSISVNVSFSVRYRSEY